MRIKTSLFPIILCLTFAGLDNDALAASKPSSKLSWQVVDSVAPNTPRKGYITMDDQRMISKLCREKEVTASTFFTSKGGCLRVDDLITFASQLSASSRIETLTKEIEKLNENMAIVKKQLQDAQKMTAAAKAKLSKKESVFSSFSNRLTEDEVKALKKEMEGLRKNIEKEKLEQRKLQSACRDKARELSDTQSRLKARKKLFDEVRKIKEINNESDARDLNERRRGIRKSTYCKEEYDNSTKRLRDILRQLDYLKSSDSAEECERSALEKQADECIGKIYGQLLYLSLDSDHYLGDFFSKHEEKLSQLLIILAKGGGSTIDRVRSVLVAVGKEKDTIDTLYLMVNTNKIERKQDSEVQERLTPAGLQRISLEECLQTTPFYIFFKNYVRRIYDQYKSNNEVRQTRRLPTITFSDHLKKFIEKVDNVLLREILRSFLEQEISKIPETMLDQRIEFSATGFSYQCIQLFEEEEARLREKEEETKQRVDEKNKELEEVRKKIQELNEALSGKQKKLLANEKAIRIIGSTEQSQAQEERDKAREEYNAASDKEKMINSELVPLNANREKLSSALSALQDYENTKDIAKLLIPKLAEKSTDLDLKYAAAFLEMSTHFDGLFPPTTIRLVPITIQEISENYLPFSGPSSIPFAAEPQRSGTRPFDGDSAASAEECASADVARRSDGPRVENLLVGVLNKIEKQEEKKEKSDLVQRVFTGIKLKSNESSQKIDSISSPMLLRKLFDRIPEFGASSYLNEAFQQTLNEALDVLELSGNSYNTWKSSAQYQALNKAMAFMSLFSANPSVNFMKTLLVDDIKKDASFLPEYIAEIRDRSYDHMAKHFYSKKLFYELLSIWRDGRKIRWLQGRLQGISGLSEKSCSVSPSPSGALSSRSKTPPIEPHAMYHSATPPSRHISSNSQSPVPPMLRSSKSTSPAPERASSSPFSSNSSMTRFRDSRSAALPPFTSTFSMLQQQKTSDVFYRVVGKRPQIQDYGHTDLPFASNSNKHTVFAYKKKSDDSLVDIDWEDTINVAKLMVQTLLVQQTESCSPTYTFDQGNSCFMVQMSFAWCESLSKAIRELGSKKSHYVLDGTLAAIKHKLGDFTGHVNGPYRFDVSQICLNLKIDIKNGWRVTGTCFPTEGESRDCPK